MYMYDQARPRNWLMIDAGQPSECHSKNLNMEMKLVSDSQKKTIQSSFSYHSLVIPENHLYTIIASFSKKVLGC